ELTSRADEFVVKHRFGSGSSGLELVTGSQVNQAVTKSLLSAHATDRAPTADDVVVQPKLPGVEHGVDIVAGLRDRGSLTDVLARRMIRMISGLTDKSVTVERGPFLRASELIARAADLTGLIDVDIFFDAA